MSKSCLVVEGGGMKCAYSTAILDRFLDDGITFDECIGVSAGAANIASYLSGQRGRNLRFYTQHPLSPDYMGIKPLITRGQFFNLRYIYGTLSNEGGDDYYDYPKALENPMPFYLVATDAKTGEAKYFRKEDMSYNHYEVMMATCCIPAMCRPIKIDGHKYFDGGVADSIPVQKAVDDGCDRIVLLLANKRTFVRPPQRFRFGYRMALLRYPKISKGIDTRHIRYAETLKNIENLEKEGKCFVVAPSDMCGVSTNCRDMGANKRLYEKGLQDYDKIKDKLLSYLKS